MGVHGLWRLLDSFGTVIQPDDLKGKRVAIDASIWIAQFRARVTPGEDIEHKILEGFLARILKLLFYGIKPVFVFDGQASATKGAEHYRRMRQRAANEQAMVKRRAKQILMAQVAAGAIDMEELKKAVQASVESAKQSESEKTRAMHNDVQEEQPPPGQEEVHVNADPVAALSPHTSHGKRRRGEPRHSKARHHKKDPRRRRRRLAPDAVSSRSTLHFLQDVEGLLEERSKHEARVLHNALHNTSTSLFMGPRRAVDDESATASKSLSGAGDASTGPQPIFVVEDNGATHAAAEEGDVVSVTDSDVDYDDVDEESDGTDDDDSSSDCCAVSLGSDVSVVSDSGVVMVQMEKRNTSSQSPAGVRGGSNGSSNGVTLLHSGDLSRYLITLSQLTPPTLSPPQTDEVTRAAAEEDVAAALTTKEKDDRTVRQPGQNNEAAVDVSARRSPPPSRPPPFPTATAVEGDSSGESAVLSVDSRSTAATEDTDEEGGEDEEVDGTGSSDEVSEDDDEDGDDESDSEVWEDDDAERDPTYAADLTWEPFTQRIDPALLLRHIAAARSGSREASADTLPPRSTDATLGAQTDNAKVNDEEDGEFTPVKLGRPSFTHPQPVTTPAAAVVVVHSSDDDDSGEGSNSVLHVSSIPPGASDASVGAKGSCAVAASFAGHGSSALSRTSTKPVASNASPPSTESYSPTAAPRPSSTRNNVAVVPFELLRVVELLDCCGVPYVLSPAEADAQCAFLARSGLVDAVFTEDSDVLVHGATTVLRGFFAQSKNVVAYRQAELAACGITKTVLVALASLLGCDYTDGVTGIGLVGALEALVVSWTARENAEAYADSPLAVLHVLRRWRELVRRPPQSWLDVDDEMSVAQFALFNSLIAQWHLLEQKASFPETPAVEAFYVAEVDTDVTPFTWLSPDWHQLRVFAGALGALSSTWLVQRFELARKEWVKREAEAAKTGAAQESGQRRLTDYGARERVRAEWAFQKQPRRHAAVLSQLRAVQLIV